MEISNYTEEKIKDEEALRLKAYKCASGKWTIGWGHTNGVRPGMVITEEQAQELFIEDVEDVESFLREEPYYPRLSDGQLDAIVSFIFNVGRGHFSTSTLRKKLMRNVNDATIPNEFRRWVYGTDPVTKKKVKLPGLVRRREWEAQMYEDL
jgi:lysozyme